MNIQRLRLIDERSSIGRKVDDGLLRDFPNRLVDRLEFSGNSRDCRARDSVRYSTMRGESVPFWIDPL